MTGSTAPHSGPAGPLAPGPNPLPTPPSTPAPAKEVGRFGQGEYHPGRSILVGAATAAAAASGYYFLFEIHKNQDLKDAISRFRTAISDFQLRLESSNEITGERKGPIRTYINSLRVSVTYQFANLTYSERTAELDSVRKILEAIKTALAGKLDAEYKRMAADFNSVRGASDAASRMKIGTEALMVGAGAGLAGGLATYYTAPASAALGKIFFGEA